MTDVKIPSTPLVNKPLISIEPQRGWVSLELADLWRYRELLLLLTWRDIKVRYAQTVLGAAWAVIQPLLTMVIFSIIFGQLAKLVNLELLRRIERSSQRHVPDLGIAMADRIFCLDTGMILCENSKTECSGL